MQYAFLGAHQGQNGAFRIQGYTVCSQTKVGYSFPEFGNSLVILVTVVGWIPGRSDQRFNSHFRWRQVRASDTQINNFPFRGIKRAHFGELPGEVIFFHVCDPICRFYHAPFT